MRKSAALRREKRRGKAAQQAAALPDGPIELSLSTAELARDSSRPALVTLYLDGWESSATDLSDPTALEFEYMQHMVAALGATMPKGPLTIAHLGGGLCSLPCALAEHYPRSRQLVIEADAKLAAQVRQWVTIPRSPEVRIRAGLAQDILPSLHDGEYHAVIRDAFIGAQVPPELTTAETAAHIHRILCDGGVYLANVVDEPGLAKVKREVAILAKQFADVAGIAEPAVWRGRRRGNVVIVASDHPISIDELHRQMRSVPFPARIIPRRELLTQH